MVQTKCFHHFVKKSLDKVIQAFDTYGIRGSGKRTLLTPNGETKDVRNKDRLIMYSVTNKFAFYMRKLIYMQYIEKDLYLTILSLCFTNLFLFGMKWKNISQGLSLCRRLKHPPNFGLTEKVALFTQKKNRYRLVKFAPCLLSL